MALGIFRRILSAYRISVVMTSIMEIVTHMPERYRFELERTGETTIPLPENKIQLFEKVYADDILMIEEKLDEFGVNFGFGIDFIISHGGYQIRVVQVNLDDDQPPIDDDDDEPVQEIENADIVEAVAPLKAMSAHG